MIGFERMRLLFSRIMNVVRLRLLEGDRSHGAMKVRLRYSARDYLKFLIDKINDQYPMINDFL